MYESNSNDVRVFFFFSFAVYNVQIKCTGRADGKNDSIIILFFVSYFFAFIRHAEKKNTYNFITRTKGAAGRCGYYSCAHSAPFANYGQFSKIYKPNPNHRNDAIVNKATGKKIHSMKSIKNEYFELCAYVYR